MYDNILVPFDGSDEALKGAEHGIELAAATGATVHALYVIDLPGVPRTVYLRDDEDDLREEYREYGEEVTGDLCEMATEQGVDCVSALRSGAPHEEIVDYAEDEGMDAIVMGVAYKGTLRGLMGSTSERVVRTASVPVITYRMEMEE